jgi:hypothetical protein
MRLRLTRVLLPCFELDIDGAGVTHALWGKGNSWVGPGNVWYARGQ